MSKIGKKATVSSNTLVLNEVRHIDQLISNLLDAHVDEIVIVDGGSRDGTWEKICAWAERTDKLVAIQWPQRAGSEYKVGFNEVGRRNLMIEASSSDYILYIDADERISPNFASSIDSSFDCIVTELIHFWNGKIRVSTPGDGVWSPQPQIRLFRRSAGFRYGSNDKNKLHNRLTYRGVKVPLGYAHGLMSVLIGKLIRVGLGLKTGGLIKPPRIYHYHYFDLSQRKKNDLRSAEFHWKMETSPAAGKPKEEGVVYISDSSLDAEAELVTKDYYLLRDSVGESMEQGV